MKETIVIGHRRSVLASFLALSAMLDSHYINDSVLFPLGKPVRNVPKYARKKEQGRNEKCNCGSGLKYKKCCGK